MGATREGGSEGGAVMTRADFDAQIGRLIVLRGWPDHADEHFSALNDIPEPVFIAAIEHALKTRTWFPVPAELRADADVVSRRVAVPLDPEPEPPAGEWTEHVISCQFGSITVKVNREWRYYCDTCNDGGKASRWCGDPKDAQRKPWYEIRTCDRRGPHASHEWVEACICVDVNPAIKRRKAAQLQQYASAPAKA